MAEILISISFKLCKDALEQVNGLRKALLDSLEMKVDNLHNELELKVCDFFLQDHMVDLFKEELLKVFSHDSSQYVYFDDYAFFESTGKLAFIPTSQSRAYLLEKIRKINSILSRLKVDMNRYDLYLFLEEKFSVDNISKIRSMAELKVVDFEFFCESIFLKVNQLEFPENYETFEIKFGNKRLPGSANEQLKLF
ncbi:hypothetical protein ORI89_08070 [Sphingobacterium sp. UT-1RO-CII-1]|uniref:hypothetical protein n=1 Tax=Sphingobacterium sp. UT-1RO-CII-1 TaxID=2995225 RepID=UPI00227D10E0|nr:hypothetical protein [Sphingobacterium sp. UT-1RO-CII-1]MCY4779604.1 hypothetical protein [Sphingobacterium sp. UT-1RO-CII-1]